MVPAERKREPVLFPAGGEPEIDNQWSIKSVSAIRPIGHTRYRCLETIQRTRLVEGYVVITQYLSAQVPGHLVEQIQRHYKASTPKPEMVIHERVVAVEMPPG